MEIPNVPQMFLSRVNNHALPIRDASNTRDAFSYVSRDGSDGGDELIVRSSTLVFIVLDACFLRSTRTYTHLRTYGRRCHTQRTRVTAPCFLGRTVVVSMRDRSRLFCDVEFKRFNRQRRDRCVICIQGVWPGPLFSRLLCLRPHVDRAGRLAPPRVFFSFETIRDAIETPYERYGMIFCGCSSGNYVYISRAIYLFEIE